MSVIDNILSCDFLKVDIYTWNQFHFASSPSTIHFRNCVKNAMGIKKMIQCVTSLNDKCMAAKSMLIKTIRLSMVHVYSLLEKYPRLKIVHLIRDPRATLRSQAKFGGVHWATIQESAAKLCNKITEDLTVSQTISKQFVDRIFTLRYEDLAEDAISFTRKLYAFLGLQCNKKVEDYVTSITRSSFETSCVVCTRRKNSTATASEWRTIINYESVVVIDKMCKNVYKRLGYLPIPRKVLLKDMSFAVKAKQWHT